MDYQLILTCPIWKHGMSGDQESSMEVNKNWSFAGVYVFGDQDPERNFLLIDTLVSGCRDIEL